MSVTFEGSYNVVGTSNYRSVQLSNVGIGELMVIHVQIKSAFVYISSIQGGWTIANNEFFNNAHHYVLYAYKKSSMGNSMNINFSNSAPYIVSMIHFSGVITDKPPIFKTHINETLETPSYSTDVPASLAIYFATNSDYRTLSYNSPIVEIAKLGNENNGFATNGYAIGVGNDTYEPVGTNSIADILTMVIFETEPPPLLTQAFLVQSENSINILFNGKWENIGSAPATKNMFTTQGMLTIDTITQAQWNELSSDSKILAYTEEGKIFKADITTSNLYDSQGNSYHGTGVIKTEMEELPLKRKSLMINADHQGCSFRYSIDNGSTWHNALLEEMIDLSTQEGTELVIEVNLPTDNATLTAISYAWA